MFWDIFVQTVIPRLTLNARRHGQPTAGVEDESRRPEL